MIRKGIRPGFKLSHGLARRRGEWHKVLPFRRSWVAITVLAIMDIVFVIPAVTTFAQAAEEWSRFESLFDLAGALFLSGWLLGWLIAPLLMTGILALMLFGREVIRVRPGTLEIVIGLPLAGIAATYDTARMRNLRVEQPEKQSGTSWRGAHLAFEYGANTVAVGSAVGAEDATELNNHIELASGHPVRRGAAAQEDIQTPWKPAEKPAADPVSDHPAAGMPPVTAKSPSAIALVLANLIPVAGTIFLGWKLSDVMVLYWAESAVIGFFNICKIAVIDRWVALLAAPFFLGHFGAFMAVHFLFIYSIFVAGPQAGMDSGGDLGKVALLFRDLWPAIAALFVSHAWSFISNFLGRHEYRGRTVRTQMAEPYSRIVFMHLVLIFGGGLTLLLGQPEPVLLIVIGLKIYFDLKAHLRERAGS